MPSDHQPAIIESMMKPDFYPHPAAVIERRETHISTVLLTGPFVYKVKKPVDLGFVDFSSLEKRRRCCQAEVRLNRRLSRQVYLDVLPITVRNGVYELDGSGETVEYAVKMHQLRDAESMAHRLTRGDLDPDAVASLAGRLADFHDQAAVDRQPPGTESAAWQENLEQLAALAPGIVDESTVEWIRTAMEAFYARHQALFQRRRQTGRIRDGHGDLRCDHIYFTDEGIQVIDCIEFSRPLRSQDTICDLAFLIMDLTTRRAGDSAWRLLHGYMQRARDLTAMPLLDFYCCYRALVRCKVACLRMQASTVSTAEAGAQRAAACNYAAMAHSYAAAFCRPRLWMLCGLPASGKSTIAVGLAELFRIAVVRSDRLRRQLFPDEGGASAAGSFGRGRYSALATETTYRQMLAMADDALKRGKSVVVDATFSRSAWRRQAIRIAEERQAPAIVVECRADDEHLIDRLQQRERQPSLSEARLAHLPAFKTRFEPVTPAEGLFHIIVDTARSPTDCLLDIVLDKRLLATATDQGGVPCSKTFSSPPT